MAGLRTRGSTPYATFPVAQWLFSAWLAAYRSGGCRGFGRTRTAFPFHPQRGTINGDDRRNPHCVSKDFELLLWRRQFLDFIVVRLNPLASTRAPRTKENHRCSHEADAGASQIPSVRSRTLAIQSHSSEAAM